MGQGSLMLTKAMFVSLANRDYLLVWLSNLGAVFAMQMQMVARGWMIYDMTKSAIALAWVTLSFMAPTLVFSLLGGVMADRLRKKWVMIGTVGLNALASLVLGTIIITDNVTFTHFILFGLFNGTVMALSMPARQAIIPGIVGGTNLVNAMALSTASMNLSRILAPAFAGVLISLVAGGDRTSALGVGVVFYIVTLFSILSVVTLLLLRHEGRTVMTQRRGMVGDIGNGLKYVAGNSAIMGLLLMGFMPLLFGMPLQFLLPVFNSEVLRRGPEGLGLLMASMGVGALIGSLVMAGLGDVRRKGLIMLASAVTWAIFTGMFALSTNLAWALPLLAMVGCSSTAYMAMNMSLVQLAVSEEMRGRVMSLSMMTFGLMPLGVFPTSILSERFGIGFALLVGAVGLGLMTLIAGVALPSIRRIDMGHEPLAQPVSFTGHPGSTVPGQADKAAKE
ncbi:MAG: transporter [Dehalococcoidia bacterium]|nr:transporter [Dehalococcoidia bacterium]